jgi:hypothetical protein
VNTINRQLPRFVPTLTEVVEPLGLKYVQVQQQSEVQNLARLIHQQIQPIVECRVKEELDRLVQTLLAENWCEIAEKIQLEINRCVDHAVGEALNKRDVGTLQK